MHLPIVALVHVCQRRGNSAFGHHRVRFAEKRFANKPDANPGSGSFDGGAQSRAAGANHEHIVFMRLVVSHSSNDPEVVPNSHRTKAHVEIGKADPEQTHPGPHHVALIQAGDATIGLK